ncbi:hypothetical protein D3C74_472760 [compost metagenome]
MQSYLTLGEIRPDRCVRLRVLQALLEVEDGVVPRRSGCGPTIVHMVFCPQTPPVPFRVQGGLVFQLHFPSDSDDVVLA